MAKQAAFGTQLLMGTAQVETATVVGTITSGGNAKTIVTSGIVAGSPLTTSFAVSLNDTADIVASKAAIAMQAVSAITSKFDVANSGATIVLTALYAAADDSSLNIETNNNGCSGLTHETTSVHTTAGVDYAAVAKIKKLAGPGMKADTADVTTLDEAVAFEEAVSTYIKSGEVTLDLIYDPNDATHDDTTGVLSALDNQTEQAFEIIWPDTTDWYFNGFLSEFQPTADVSGALTATVKIKLTGAPVLA